MQIFKIRSVNLFLALISFTSSFIKISFKVTAKRSKNLKVDGQQIDGQTDRPWAPARREQGGQAPTLEKIRVGMAHPGNFSRGLKTSWQ